MGHCRMPSLQQRLQWLRAEARPDRAAILVAAVRRAGEDELQPICEALVDTGEPAALAAVVRRLHRLGPRGLEMLGAAPGGSFESAVRLVLAQERRSSTLNAIEVIERRADPALFGELGRLLDSSLPGIAERAGGALLAVTVAQVGPHGRRRSDRRATQRLDETLAAAVESYHRHRRDDVLLAAAVMSARPGPNLALLLDDPRHPAAFALRGVVDRLLARNPLVSRNLISWLGVPALRAQAARWMHRLEGPRQYAELLADGHLMLAPARRRAIRGADRPIRCLPDAATAVTLPAAAQAHLPFLAASLGLTTPHRLRCLADMIALPSPIARLKALLALLGHESVVARQSIDRFCFDRSESIARLAAQRVLSCARPGGPDEPLLARLERSPHRWIAGRAAVCLARFGAQHFFQRWTALSEAERRAAAHLVLSREPRAFLARLREILIGGPRSERIAAIGLGRRLGLVPRLEGELIDLAAGADPHVAASAVAGLAEARSARRLDALRNGLKHPDARVRANAVEAMMRTAGAETIDLLTPITASGENRARANAVRAMLSARPGEGLVRLQEMLADANPLHRISGIWVAGRARATPVAGALRRLAAHDRLRPVRLRASATVRLLAPRPTRGPVQREKVGLT